jgi:hypothetical protein
VILDGTIINGCGAATRTVAQQLSEFIKQYDELREVYAGTINVKVQDPIDLKIDFRALPQWTGIEFTSFEFIRILFEYPLGIKVRAWIYHPYGYHWGVRNRKNEIEVLLKKIDRVICDSCRIHILNEHGSSSISSHYLREQRK